MEVKTAAWSTVALVIVAFGAVVIYSIEREGIKNDLSKAGRELESQEAGVEAQKKALRNRKTEYEAILGRASAIENLEKETAEQKAKNEAAIQQVNHLRGAWADIRKTFAGDIETVRRKAKSEVMPELTLVDGKSLKSVHFKEIKDNVVILEHTDGIARVPMGNMNKDWMGRLALGWNPKLSAELSGVPDAPETVAAPEAVVPTVEEARQSHVESVKRADVSQMEAKIRSLTRQISDAQASLTRQNDIADEYNAKYLNAMAKGNSSNHKGKRDAALKAAKLLESQIAAAQNQISTLTQQISDKAN